MHQQGDGDRARASGSTRSIASKTLRLQSDLLQYYAIAVAGTIASSTYHRRTFDACRLSFFRTKQVRHASKIRLVPRSATLDRHVAASFKVLDLGKMGRGLLPPLPTVVAI